MDPVDLVEVNYAPCFGCSKSKLRRRKKKKNRIHPAKEILEVTHTDLLTMPEGRGGFRYVITFLDEKSAQRVDLPNLL